MKKVYLSLCILLFATSSAFAGTVYFQDDFNNENFGVGALDYNSFSKWTVSGGTVDLIGNGFYDLQPGNGLYLDMDGSTKDAGKISTSVFLDAGDYFLDFDLAGNHRVDSWDSISFQVDMGVLGTTTVSTGRDLSFTSFYSLFPSFSTFTVVTGGNYTLSFEGLGGDNIGLLLDNVKIESVDPVPEPATMLLFGTGLVGLVGVARRKKK